jgi:hypothetical protein
MSHRFNLGQTVMFSPGAFEILESVTKATVSRLLPKEGADYQYHVQVEADGLARRVREKQLELVDSLAAF